MPDPIKIANIEIGVDTEGFEQGVAVVEQMLSALQMEANIALTTIEAQAEATTLTVKQAAQAGLAMANVMLSTVQNVVRTLGLQLDPLHEMILSIITTSVQVSLSLAAMWESNPYTLALGIAISAISISTGINASYQAYLGKLQAQAMQMYSLAQLVRGGDHLKAAMSMIRAM